MIECVIAIDPGISGGGIAVAVGDDVQTYRMPKEIGQIKDILAMYAERYNTVVFLEKLSVRPDDVAVQDGCAAMGKMYRIQKMMANFEHLKAIMGTLDIPYIMVHPGKWSAYLGLRRAGSGETRAEKKRRYKMFAAEKFPNSRVTLWNADALNILYFGRWVLVHEPKWLKAQLPEREHVKLFLD